MKARASIIVAGISLMAQGMVSSGCSVIGLAVDASSPADTLAVTPGEKTMEGKNVLVTMRDGYSFAGECRKVGSLPGELYRSRFARWHETPANRAFPLSPGDSLQISIERGQIIVGSLESFTRTSVVVLPAVSSPFVRRPLARSIPVESIDSLSTSGRISMDGRTLREHFGVIPTADAVLIRRAETMLWVPLDDIAQMSEIRYSYHWLQIGAIADAIGLAAVTTFFVVTSH